MPDAISARQNLLVPYILAGCTAVSILSTDLLTPSIPALPMALDTDIRMAQFTVGINLVAYALAQLVHGPLSDSVGRRKLLLWAFSLFAITSMGCAMATSIEGLLLGRFLQGLFSSVPSVVIILIIRELYGPTGAVRAMALYGLTFGVAPALGPLIGGYLQLWFGWSAGFWVSAGLALFMMMAFFLSVPETVAERRAVNVRGAVGSYGQLVANARYMRLAIALSASFGAYFAYVTTAPVIFIELLGMPTERYGLTNVAVVAAFMVGSVTAARVARRLPPCVILRRSAVVMLAGIVLLVLPFFAGVLSIGLILTAMAIYALGFAGLMASGPVILLDSVPDLPPGPASALFGSMQLAAAAVAGLCSAFFYDGTALSMGITMLVLVAAGTVLLVRNTDGTAVDTV